MKTMVFVNSNDYDKSVYSITFYKNNKKITKKDALTKEIMSELGKGIKYKSINNNNLLRIRSYSSFFEPKKRKEDFMGVQGINII
jgi:hypothetical protein